MDGGQAHRAQTRSLINGPGEKDYAAAYGVTEIPTNVLIDRDGKVVHIDLVNKNLDGLAAYLKPGSRAIAIKVDPVSLVGGFVLGWRVLDRRIRAKYGGLRIY